MTGARHDSSFKTGNLLTPCLASMMKSVFMPDVLERLPELISPISFVCSFGPIILIIIILTKLIKNNNKIKK